MSKVCMHCHAWVEAGDDDWFHAATGDIEALEPLPHIAEIDHWGPY